MLKVPMTAFDITGHDESYESSHPDSRADLMHDWNPELYMTSNAYPYPEQMQHYNYPKNDIYGDYRSNQMYHSDLFSPDDMQSVKRADRFDPSKDFLKAQTPDISENYCCCKSKRQCIRISTVVVIFSAILLGLVLFFCWPRIPVFSVSERQSDLKGLVYSPSNSNNDPLLALKEASIGVPFKAFVSFSVPVIVNSSNYIDISVNSITVSAKIVNPSGTEIPFLNGSGEMTNIIISKHKSTILYFVIIDALIIADDGTCCCNLSGSSTKSELVCTVRR
jgi:hypothetical protein